jgi:signal transduction histidine kinase
MRVGRLLAATTGVLLLLAIVGIGLALIANSQLTHNRHLLLNQIGPSVRSTLALENALINEETGVRGYLIARDRSFLAPYLSGRQSETRAYADLRAREQAIGATIAHQVENVHMRAQAWRREFVARALAHPRRVARRPLVDDVQGMRLFDSVRGSLARLRTALMLKDVTTRERLDSSATTLESLLAVAAVLILGGVLGAGYLLRRTITHPLARLGSEARRVASGHFDVPLAVARGPLEIAEVGAEIDAMRERIVEELATVQAAHLLLEEQARELARSNAELEQFAYVASHDLQEPLRKVASFCQALQTRYHGRLDERADQYIEFAVDGAKRMQSLINDLLAFSRVGRGGRALERVDLGEVLGTVWSALSDVIQSSGASVLAGELPTVRGDRTQLASLFHNLIANAIKFRGDDPPLVRIGAVRRDAEWELTCADNGIGIDPEYAERIFLIFQRLHSREAYEGSGIGLALCRKIVEYHGGRIWLDPHSATGARFRFTLPVAMEDK